ncbi:MAG: beta-propeller fold lactonase family protein [Chloroflexi bacterium]|nr:beta-propeller fold lactonase family protein [Chloroflexota bacterium]MCI0643482.1 beta-propeller fold lactonase family protein [Chloroflexota bacterium]
MYPATSVFRFLRSRRLTAVFLLVLAIGFIATSSTPALAQSTTTVNTTAVADNPNDSKCDLWEALQAIADYNNGSDTDSDGSIATYHECSTGSGPHFIVFSGPAAGGTITLPTALYSGPFTGLPYVTDDVTITGPVVIDGGGPTINDQIFTTNAGGKLTLTNLVVQNGYTSGGGAAILSLGGDDVINIVNSSIQNNTAEGNGGAINALGQVNVLMSNFSGNKALGKDANGSDYPGQGGAIYMSGYSYLNISLSNFAGNIATEGGGAIFTTADSGQITDTVFNGNVADDDAITQYTYGGGAIYNGGNDSDTGLTITRVAFDGNLSFNAHGGAIYNAPDGYLHVYDSSFNGNIAGDLSHEEMGGAIYNQEVLDIRRVMFLANVSSRGNGGAIANDRTGQATFGNVTFTANGAPDGDGGAIWNGNTQQGGPASNVFLYNVTLSLNASPNAGAAIFNQTDGSHTVTLASTIVDGIGIAGNSCNEFLTSQGYNIDSSTSCGLTQITDQPNTDPGLELIGFNGGPLVSLLTHALEVDSAAIDAGSNAVCANEYVGNLDQRSDPRPKGIACDVGAFETEPLVAGYGSDPVPPGPIVIGNTSVGVSITNTFTIFSIGNTELEVDNPVITGPGAGQFQVLTPFPVNTSFQEDIVLRCNASALGSFTAFLAFTTNVPNLPAVTYQLECNVNAAPTAGFGSDPIAPGPLDFGAVEVGEPAVRTLTFFETGNATLNVPTANLSGAHPGDFTFNPYDTTINNGEPPVQLPITCTPSGFGLRTATLTLATNDPTQTSVSYNLVCEGVAPPPAPLAAPGYSYINGQGGLNSLDGAYDIAISPDGLNAYVTSYVDDTLTVFDRNAGTGELSFVMSTSNVDLNGPAMVEVSPDGTQVYVTAIDSDSFLIYSRNAGSGIVVLDTVWTNGDGGGVVTGLDYPYGVVASPDGRFIYVTSFFSNAIVTFYRDEDGFVGYEGALVDNTNLYRAYLPAISPDGKHIYVSGGSTSGNQDDGYVTAYERDILDGSLTFVQHRYEGQLIGCTIICFYISGLSGAWGITVSPDGNNVYVAGYYDDAIVRFIRNPFDGTLTYGGRITNSLAQTEPGEGIDAIEAEGLDGAMNVKVSPDGQYLYATGYDSDALAVFARNSSNGVLTQVQTLYPAAGLPALDGAREISVSPDGTAVYATGYQDDAVVAFHTANPVATLSSLLPASAPAGSPALTVRVQGQNFVPGSVVRVDGANRPTAYVNPGELEVEIPGSELASPGSLTIQVLNPAPGGGLSVNSLLFSVTNPGQNPIPSIDSLLPQGANAGDPAFSLTLYGVNFVNGATVKWNGSNRTTTFVNSTELHAAITAEDLLAPGSAVIAVVNPGPGGGASNTVVFDVAAPGQNPAPSVTGIDPEFTVARGAASIPLVLRVFGQNFVPGAQGQWNGENRPTQFISETEVRVTLNGFDVAFGGSGAITIVNPTPGGGPSNPATFIIYPYAVYIPIILK